MALDDWLGFGLGFWFWFWVVGRSEHLWGFHGAQCLHTKNYSLDRPEAGGTWAWRSGMGMAESSIELIKTTPIVTPLKSLSRSLSRLFQISSFCFACVAAAG